MRKLRFTIIIKPTIHNGQRVEQRFWFTIQYKITQLWKFGEIYISVLYWKFLLYSMRKTFRVQVKWAAIIDTDILLKKTILRIVKQRGRQKCEHVLLSLIYLLSSYSSSDLDKQYCIQNIILQFKKFILDSFIFNGKKFVWNMRLLIKPRVKVK